MPRQKSQPVMNQLVDYGSNIKLPKFAALREPLQYEDLKAMVELAAKEDGAGQSLDKYIFHMDGVEVDSYRTEFEKTIPEVVELETTRLQDAARRDATLTEAHLLGIKKKANKLAAQKLSIEEQTASIDRSMKRELSVLKGEEPGAAGVYRPGRQLVTAGPAARLFLNSKSLLLKAITALIDGYVVALVMSSLLGNGYEGLIFGASAILIQILVPHLIGEKLSFLLKVQPKPKFQSGYLVALAIIWLAVVSFLTFVRADSFSKDLAKKELPVDQINTLATVFEVFTAAVLIGLGLLIIWDVFKTNKHELSFMNLEYKKRKLAKKLFLKNAQIADTEAELAVQLNAVKRLDESSQAFQKNVESIYPTVGQHWYRRELVNVKNDPYFTTEATK